LKKQYEDLLLKTGKNGEKGSIVNKNSKYEVNSDERLPTIVELEKSIKELEKVIKVNGKKFDEAEKKFEELNKSVGEKRKQGVRPIINWRYKKYDNDNPFENMLVNIDSLEQRMMNEKAFVIFEYIVGLMRRLMDKMEKDIVNS